MPSTAKVRSTALLTGGVQVGTSGSPVAKLIWGTFVAAVPQFTASGPTLEVATATVYGVESGMKIWLQAVGGCGIFCSSASVTADNTVSGSFGIADHAATGGACNITFQYLAVK